MLKKIEPAYISKYKYKHKNQVISLMITDDGKRWHYLAVKNLPALLRGITSNHHGYFYCLNCFHSYKTHNKLKKQERVCNNHDYCYVDMPKEHEKNKILTRGKVIKSSVYNLCGFRVSTKKLRSCQNNPENSYTEKKVKRKP